MRPRDAEIRRLDLVDFQTLGEFLGGLFAGERLLERGLAVRLLDQQLVHELLARQVLHLALRRGGDVFEMRDGDVALAALRRLQVGVLAEEAHGGLAGALR